MLTDRAKVLQIELTLEGGKVDDPNDPGGRTNQGVTQRVYGAYRTAKGLTPRSVYLMTNEERDEIYLKQYFAPVQFDSLPAGLDLLMVDGSIHSGPVQATKWLQRALGSSYTGRVDGALGQGTLGAVLKCTNVEGLIRAVVERRMTFLRENKNWRHFKNGWASRVDQVQATALAMCTGSDHAPVSYVLHGNQKATLHTAYALPSAAPGAGLGGVGVASTVVVSYVGQLKSQIEPVLATLPPTALPHELLQAAVHYADVTTTWVTSAGGVGAVLGAVWAAYAGWRAARLRDALDLHGADPATAAPAKPQ